MIYKTIIKIILKNKYINNIIYVAKNGNFAMLTALIIPLTILIAGVSIDITRYFFYQETIASAINEAIEEGFNIICTQETNNFLAPTIKNDIKESLIRNNFTIEETVKLMELTTVQAMPNDNAYFIHVNSIYRMQLNALMQAITPKEYNKWDIIIDDARQYACKYTSAILINNVQTWRPETAQGKTISMNRFSQQEIHSWKIQHSNFVKNILSFSDNHNVMFYSISGNKTDFGETWQTDMFAEVYFRPLLHHKTFEGRKTPFYMSMGSSEYLDNANTCRHEIILDPFKQSPDCSMDTINFTIEVIKYNKDLYNDYNADYSIINKGGFVYDTIQYSGSMAFSWNIDNLHFIQTHDNMFRKASYHDQFYTKEYEIYSLINSNGTINTWLQDDINKARQKNQTIILLSEDIQNELLRANDKQKMAFIRLLTNNKISVIFSTSDNKTYEKRGLLNNSGFYSEVMVYYLGSANLKNFVLLEKIGKRLVRLTEYSGRSGRIVKTQEMSPIYLH
ncbi:MAG: hypothetical protein DBO98_02800 [Candidatus Liberibacter europaeus]|nr:hypothetical protein [Candidatus Liberibacter europaeus]